MKKTPITDREAKIYRNMISEILSVLVKNFDDDRTVDMIEAIYVKYGMLTFENVKEVAAPVKKVEKKATKAPTETKKEAKKPEIKKAAAPKKETAKKAAPAKAKTTVKPVGDKASIKAKPATKAAKTE